MGNKKHSRKIERTKREGEEKIYRRRENEVWSSGPSELNVQRAWPSKERRRSLFSKELVFGGGKKEEAK